MVCKNCGYNNRDGVDFCRHCGISLKLKSRKRVKTRPSAVKAERRTQSYGDFLNTQNAEIPPRTREDNVERAPRSGGGLRTATLAAGIVIIVCFIAFCMFAFDILKLPGTGGSVTVDSIILPSDNTAAEPAPGFTPVLTITPAE